MQWKYLARRLLLLLLNLWLVVSLVFFMFRLIPGDPTVTLVGPGFPTELRDQVLRSFGLDRPLHEQYFLYIAGLARGDLGWSFFYNRPVVEVVGNFLPNTLVLGFASLILAYLLGVTGGVILAWKRNSPIGSLGILVPLVFRSAPVFWTGMVILMYFSYQLNWFPYSGMRTPGYEADTWVQKYVSLDFAYHLILPTVVSALYFMGLPMLLTRSSMLEIFGEEFVDFARARGLSEPRVILGHVLRNALLPVTTAAAVAFGLAVGGQVVTEYVFSWPGIGREIVLATQRRDYPVTQAMFLIIAATTMFANLGADILYARLDPRVRLG